jgi:hypothetical protein
LKKAEELAMQEEKDNSMEFLNDPEFLKELEKDAGIAEEDVIKMQEQNNKNKDDKIEEEDDDQDEEKKPLNK